MSPRDRRVATPWRVALLCAAIAAAAVVAWPWQLRTASDPLQPIASRLASLDETHRQKVCAHRVNPAAAA